MAVAGRVGVLRLNKPRALNALCAVMATQLMEALQRAAANPEVGAVLLTGNGRAFCAGSDLSVAAPVPGLSPSERGDLMLSRYFNPIARMIRSCPKPVVVAVNGLTVGGGVGLALSGDVVIAAESAEFRLNFGPKLGLVPDLGCTWLLPQAIGRPRALALALTGEPLPAATAQQWGLIWSVTADAELEVQAVELAGRLAEGPADAFATTRRLMDQASRSDLSAQLEDERAAQIELMGGDDFAEGVRAFKEKRTPRFGPHPPQEMR